MLYNQNNQMPQQSSNPAFQMDFANPQAQQEQNFDQMQKLKKRQKMVDMLGGMMQSQQAPNMAGGLSGVLGGLTMGMADNQNQSDFKDLLKNGAFGGAGMGLSKYFTG